MKRHGIIKTALNGSWSGSAVERGQHISQTVHAMASRKVPF